VDARNRSKLSLREPFALAGEHDYLPCAMNMGRISLVPPKPLILWR
jgi:hypothetical protein